MRRSPVQARVPAQSERLHVQVFILHMQPFLVSVRHPENNFAAHFAAKILDTVCSQLYKNAYHDDMIISIQPIPLSVIFLFFSNTESYFLLGFLPGDNCYIGDDRHRLR